MSRVELVGVIFVVLAWPVFAVPVALDLYFVLSTGNSHAGLATVLLTGGPDWPLWVMAVAAIVAILVSASLAKGWALGRTGAGGVCTAGALVFGLQGATYLVMGPMRWVVLVSLILLAPHIWALHVIRKAAATRA